ncbi:MAG: metalloregulator ArsR/SmtB family transcription factor [Candidatus Omnitrophica bacterium]|nr:metalloregulator ArsR/SmtB family transcription factor [Candidatus Omnitrophota bacterium]
MKQYLDLFSALSDETRLRIMVLLSEKELCVCQIEWALGLPQAKVSRHLAILRYAGLVKDRRDGLWIYYSLAEPKNEIEKNLFECFRKCLRKEDSFKTDLSCMKRCIAKPLDLVAEMAKKL